MHTKINWFEIPSLDFERATRFYETLFDTKLQAVPAGPDAARMALFSAAGGEPCGCVTHSKEHQPGTSGTLIYLDAGPAIDAVLARIEPAGGTIHLHKLELPDDIGFIAHFTDTEGNLLALHAH